MSLTVRALKFVRSESLGFICSMEIGGRFWFETRGDSLAALHWWGERTEFSVRPPSVVSVVNALLHLNFEGL